MLLLLAALTESQSESETMNSISMKERLAGQLAPPKLKRDVLIDTNVIEDESSKINVDEKIPKHRKIKPTESLWKISASQKFKAAAILSSRGLQKAGKSVKPGKFIKLDIVSMREMLFARGFGRAKVITTIHNVDRSPPPSYVKSHLPRVPNRRIKESTKFEYDVTRMKVEEFLSEKMTSNPGVHAHQRPDVQRRKGVRLLPPLTPIHRKPGTGNDKPDTLLQPVTIMKNIAKLKFRDIGSEPQSGSYKILSWLHENETKVEEEKRKEIEKERKRKLLLAESSNEMQHAGTKRSPFM